MEKALIFFALPIIGHCMLISSPFDNFRIECPQNSGAQRLSIKMVESQGMKRQDTVFALSCNKVDEVYPWSNIPQGVLELEREDCHYTSMFDPIMDTNVSHTCGPREYLAGITRVTDTRIQTMCCRLRTREEANCENIRFGKPLGYNGKVEIQLNGKLVNALTIEKNLYKVRFCDLVPRAIEAILNDIKTTTIRPFTLTTSSSTTEQTTSKPLTTFSNKPVMDQIKEKEATKLVRSENITNEPLILNDVTEPVNISAGENEIKKLDASEEASQELELFQTSTIAQISESMTPPTIEKTNSSTSSTPSDGVETSAEAKILSPSHELSSNINQNASDSLEVQASPMPRENIFPTDKDYENIEEAEVELMSTIAEMIKARKIAKNIISKVRAAGVKQQIKEKQEKMAEDLLREIEGETDPAKADELFKQSVEMLNELSDAKHSMSIEEFSKEMMRQEMKKDKEIEPTLRPDSLELDVFDNDNISTRKLTTLSLLHILTSTNAPPPKSTVANINEFLLSITQPTVTMLVTATSSTLDSLQEYSEKNETKKLMPVSQTAVNAPLPIDAVIKLSTTVEPAMTHIPITTTMHSTISTSPSLTDNSKSLEDAFEYQIPKSVFFKKHINKHILKPSVENGPSKEILAAASSSNEARRAPAKYFEEPLATLPPLDNFPSPPSRTHARNRPLELPRVSPPREEYRPPVIEFDEYDELFRQTTAYPYYYKSHRKHTTLAHVAPNARGNFVDQPYVDELTRNSPFETSYENRVIPSVRPRFRPTTTPPQEITTSEAFTEATTESALVYETQLTPKSFSNDNSPFDFPEIRRAPIPRRKAYEEYKKFDEISTSQSYAEKIALDAITTTKPPESQPLTMEKTEKSQIDFNDGEGVISYEPANNKQMEIQKAKDLLIEDITKTQVEAAEYPNEQDDDVQENEAVETLVPMNAMDQSTSVETNVTEAVTEEPSTSETVTTDSSTMPTATSPPSTTAEQRETGEYYIPEYQDPVEPEPPTYDPRAFYHTLPPRPVIKKGKYLTFCTKDLAIRDTNNMVVACGSESEVWEPKRCPDGTDCFYTTDSTFRICCPVANG